MVDGSYTRSGADEELFPTGPYTAVVTLDAASMEQWEEFSHAMAGIVGSVEFPPNQAAANGSTERSDFLMEK